MKISTPKPKAPEPMEISTGNAYYVNLEEVVTSLSITYKKMGKCVLYPITISKKIFTYFFPYRYQVWELVSVGYTPLFIFYVNFQIFCFSGGF